MRYPSLPFVAPFGAFIALLALGGLVPFGPYEYAVRCVVLAAILIGFSRRAVDLSAPFFLGSILLGALVFVLWIAPDWFWLGYRRHWLFQNAFTGMVGASLPAGYRLQPVVLIPRLIQTVALVPILEELFWRAWLMRWLIHRDFQKVRLGAFTLSSFLITAFLFALEHGPYWDVGLAAGLLYNAWMVRTRSLGDCIIAHLVTNALLSAYVVLAGKWEYWL